MSYIRKTEDVWTLLQKTSEGWEEVTAETSGKEIRKRLKEYQANQPGYAYRIKLRREKIIEKDWDFPPKESALFTEKGYTGRGAYLLFGGRVFLLKKKTASEIKRPFSSEWIKDYRIISVPAWLSFATFKELLAKSSIRIKEMGLS